MCLSTAVVEKEGSFEKVCEYVSQVRTEGRTITFTDVMGTETAVSGVIKSMDFIKNIIIIEE